MSPKSFFTFQITFVIGLLSGSSPRSKHEVWILRMNLVPGWSWQCQGHNELLHCSVRCLLPSQGKLIVFNSISPKLEFLSTSWVGCLPRLWVLHKPIRGLKYIAVIHFFTWKSWINSLGVWCLPQIYATGQSRSKEERERKLTHLKWEMNETVLKLIYWKTFLRDG